MTESAKQLLSSLFPENSRLLLTGGGKEFVERIGIEAVRKVVLGVLRGENIRTQTEPLTRRRISQVCGALVALFAKGWIEVDDFSKKVSEMAMFELQGKSVSDKAILWPAQWAIGLTGKLSQNALRGKTSELQHYINVFEYAVLESAHRCEADIGPITMKLGLVTDGKSTKELNWEDITRLTTALGCAALTLRGSDKSIYGKLFERLVLGSALSILGFQRTSPKAISGKKMVFWLSDSRSARESDATALFEPGKLARFDIGFIGPGNSEISKDKLSRYEREMEVDGAKYSSRTFIIVDRLPQTSKTKKAAERIGAEIIQMSLRYWPQELAQYLAKHFSFEHTLVSLPEEEVGAYLDSALSKVPIQEFVAGISAGDLPVDEELEEIEDEMRAEN